LKQAERRAQAAWRTLAAMEADTRIGDAAWPGYALPHGSIVNGYRIERVLGSGGFGVTYLASDLLGQRFAVKEYYPRQFATRAGSNVVPASVEDRVLFQDCRDRFLREGQALVVLGRAAGASQGIVRVQTCFEACGTCFLVMDYIEGCTLASVLRQHPDGIDAARLRDVLMHLLDSIRIVHGAHLLHRDIKPANIILRDDDRPVLIDFGSTRDTTRGEGTQFTQIYTSGYAPPEQRLGLPQDRYSDIYAIGAVGYRAIGGMPVDSLSRQRALDAGKADPQHPAVEFGAGRYPVPLLAAIDAALAIDPARRPQTAEAMLALLRSAGPGTAPRPATARGARRAGWRSEWQGLAAGIAVAAVLGVGYRLWPHRGVPPPAPISTAEPVAAGSPPAPAGQANTRSETAIAPVQTAAGSASPIPEPPTPRAAAQSPEPAPPPASEATPKPAAAAATQPPQREALLVPPLHRPPPVATAPEPSPLQRAQQLLAALPCAALTVQPLGGALEVHGFAGPGLEPALVQLRRLGAVTDRVEPVDPFACAPLDAFAGPFAAGRGDPERIALGLHPAEAKSGTTVRLDYVTALPVVALDVYRPDGAVEHIAQPARSQGAGGGSLDWTARLAAGRYLVAAVASDSALLSRARSEREPAATYLSALRGGHAAAAVAFAVLTVEPAEPKAAKPAAPHLNPRSERCANILSRVQLGEILSDAERTALRTECRY
jgi:hypothetical protein